MFDCVNTIHRIAASCGLLIAGWTSVSRAAENWPMWRYDAQRSAASPNQLPDDLQLLWSMQQAPREPVWDDPLNQDLMPYDRIFEPIVMDGRMFVGFNDQDKLLAVDTASGQPLWTFFAEAPIRLPPVGWRDRVLVCSDDGFLYCLRAEDGQLLWRFSGAPGRQHALGNRRLTSAWPARGGPVVRDDTVYFAASIWPFMGTFIYALNAENGQLRWVNDSTGAQYIKQPHSAPSFAGVAPQGALLATENYLIVPGGRSVPAVFERADGRFKYFEIEAGGKGSGGSFVAADAVHFYLHTRHIGTRAFNIETGVKTAFMPNQPVIWGDFLFAAYSSSDQSLIRAYPANLNDDKYRDSVWNINAPAMSDLILAGQHLIAADQQTVTVIGLPEVASGKLTGGQIVRQFTAPENIGRLLVADHKLLAVSESGTIYAYGQPATSAVSEQTTTKRSATTQPAEPQSIEAAVVRVQHMIAQTNGEGYAFWFGECDPAFIAAWAQISPFVQLAVVDSNPQRVDAARRQLDALGAYGTKITVHCSVPRSFSPPQNIAHSVFVSEELASQWSDADIQAVYSAVRPFGGAMLIERSDAALIQQTAEHLSKLQLEQAQLTIHPNAVVVRRVGPLPGSADWTHQHGDIANSVKSDDSRVKMPLGILWFGGNSNLDVLPRHGHGPPQQVVAGRLVIQGHNCLSARDVYTGRVLWHRDFDDLGTFDVYYDQTYEDAPLDTKYNQVHIPGANARGTNYVVTEDRIYLVMGNTCKILDAASGQDRGQISMPTDEAGDQLEWGFIGVYDNVLLGGLGFAKYRQRLGLEIDGDKLLKGNKAAFGSKSLDRAASRALLAFDRHSGQLLWRVDAQHSFWHNGIVAGGGKVYCLDRHPAQIEEALKRRGQLNSQSNRILALDAQTGQGLWEVREHVVGTWLGYSQEYDLLLQAGARGSDRLADEIGKGMRVYQAATGSLQWAQDDLSYSGPCILHHQWILTNTNAYSQSAGAFDIRTGQPRMIKNPLTGQLQPWRITRAYGCNQIIASENLLTFRSGAAGYYDLLTDAGTGNIGGFKSGCTSNLIVANGVLNAPDYTRTCSCAYQNQTSLALVHMPDVDVWATNLTATLADADTAIESVGINFGAPGDRRDEDGVLWIEYPHSSGDPPPLSIRLNEGVRFVQQHSSAFLGADNSWVLSSGAVGATHLRIGLITQIQSRPAKSGSRPKESDSDDELPAEVASVTAEVTDSTNNQSVAAHAYDIELYFGTTSELHDGGLPPSFEVRLTDVNQSQQVTMKSTALTAGLDQIQQPAATRSGLHAHCRFENVLLSKELNIELVAKPGNVVISGVRLVRTNKPR
ncbi:MAG: PQQ-binding-like beta-propeller repeat protein [Pirellulaceae bacterium]|nr:PQQ-binding-like beta-propeller repeat protein [Pirellulaceae bacterium]